VIVNARSAGVVRCIALVALVGAFGACDDDPSGPETIFPDASLDAIPDTLGIQQAIRVVFDGLLDPGTALDRANFVVTNLCTGLAVPGALRLGRDEAGQRDTLIFTPSQPLPYLSLIGVRIQNLLTPEQVSLPQPITFSRIVEPPPIRDQSWEFLSSPTDDFLTGISFANRTIGFTVGLGGTVYRTPDGGRTWIARFKDIELTNTFNIHAFGPDTVFMVGAKKFGTVTRNGLFRSTNGGLSFDTVATVGEFQFSLHMVRAGGRPQGVFGGISGTAAAYRYDGTTNTVTRATGLPSTFTVLTGVSLSPSAARALVTLRGFPDQQQGFAFVSQDGGLTYTQLTLPANTFSLSGSGFVDDRTGFVVGDSSVVLRFDASNPGAGFTLLGADQGIPQTARNATTGEVTTYSFRKVRFVPGTQVGWMIGGFTRRLEGVPDVVGGVILMSEDGGLTWRRQAVSGASENGLAFPPILDLQALETTFAAASGSNGFLAARTVDAPSGVTACSFVEP
jgi:photosystem II stability/assembly factor-like uncharacterized protein